MQIINGKARRRVWPFCISTLVANVELRNAYPPAPANFRCWKHSLQNTGRPCVGRKGTVVSLPHAEQVVWVSTRSRIEGPALIREPTTTVVAYPGSTVTVSALGNYLLEVQP